jgi:hypothetical protein
LSQTRDSIARGDGVSMQDADQFVAIAGRDLCPASASGSSSPSGSSCNSASCVPNVTHTAVLNGPCTIGTRYIFGLDASGNTWICTTSYSQGGSVIKGVWAQAPPLIGVRDPGSPCSGSGVAQSPDGSPMMCQNQGWVVHMG